ncbi:unnamed protein product [Paramecium octaurelia]|uniref:Uncharacterized protein n=1 Tax=Paramecium octaurelia TaxID=43137 RepID=A0A8S1XS35_PAROT|nr:unnamed protein product [Paramecium octaurelia]
MSQTDTGKKAAKKFRFSIILKFKNNLIIRQKINKLTLNTLKSTSKHLQHQNFRIKSEKVTYQSFKRSTFIIKEIIQIFYTQ